MRATLQRFYDYLIDNNIIEFSNHNAEKLINDFLRSEGLSPSVLVLCDSKEDAAEYLKLTDKPKGLVVIDSSDKNKEIVSEKLIIPTRVEPLIMSGQESRRERRKNKRKGKF